MSHFLIHAKWDAEAGVWSAYSDDIPGLVTEAETWDRLQERIRAVIPELLAENHIPVDPAGADYSIIAEVRETLAA